MINPEFAQNFIMRIHRQLGIDVNIMNEKGVIIASSMTERIGDFHVLAYEIIKNKQSMRITETMDISDAKLIGVNMPGVNMLLTDGREAIGVVGVSGTPKETLPYAKMLKFTFEALWEHEKTRITLSEDQGPASKFLDALFFEKPVNPARINKIAKQLGYRENTIRVPLYLHLEGEDLEQAGIVIQENFQRSALYSSQDILLQMDAQHLLLCKSIEENQIPYCSALMQEYWSELTRGIRRSEDMGIRSITGPPQRTFIHYRKIYELLLWVEAEKKIPKDELVECTDYLLDYLVSKAEASVLDPVFSVYAQIASSAMEWDIFSQTMEALIQSDMHLQDASKLLFMHKNTIQTRMEKVKKSLGIQPLKSTKDAVFLIALYAYIKRRT